MLDTWVPTFKWVSSTRGKSLGSRYAAVAAHEKRTHETTHFFPLPAE
jgi:hypothetical protein